MNLSTGDSLRAAAQRVREGWTQGFLIASVSYQSRLVVCAIGALGITERGIGRVCQCQAHAAEIDAIIHAIEGRQHRLGQRYAYSNAERIMLWNDAPTQTQETVAVTLELAGFIADEEDRVAAIGAGYPDSRRGLA